MSLSAWEAGEEYFFAATIRDISGHRHLRKEVRKVEEEVSKRLQDIVDLLKESTGEVQHLSSQFNSGG